MDDMEKRIERLEATIERQSEQLYRLSNSHNELITELDSRYLDIYRKSLKRKPPEKARPHKTSNIIAILISLAAAGLVITTLECVAG